MENKEVYIQIGVTALRSRFGDFLPPVPLYIKSKQTPKENGFTQAEEEMLKNVAFPFAWKLAGDNNNVKI